MAGADDELYAFERRSEELRLPPATRSREDAARAVRILRRRLGIADAAKLDKEFEKLLVRYCTDTILNILWYDRARKREERANTQRTALMVVLMGVALLLLVMTGFSPTERADNPGAAVLPLAFLAGGALTVLQVAASLSDGKARLAIFWKAGADLKEALYNFEHKWHGRVLKGEPLAVCEEFDAAVQDELRLARAVTRAERLEFFANLRSPSDVVAVAMTAMNGLRERRAESGAVAVARDERMATAKKSVSEARAAVLASEFRLRAIGEGADRTTDRTAEEAVLLNAKAEVVRTEAILHELIGG